MIVDEGDAADPGSAHRRRKRDREDESPHRRGDRRGRDDPVGHKISYPPSWIVTPGTAKRSDEFDNYDRPYLFVDRATVSGIASVSLTVTNDVAYMKSHYKAKLVGSRVVKLAGGYTGKYLIYQGTDQGVAITVQKVIVAKGRVGYFIDIWGYREQESPDVRLFKQIYTSWRPI